jgi:cytochrome c biogenesis protein CcmG, thiol:disulfide interchange protein DsbE
MSSSRTTTPSRPSPASGGGGSSSSRRGVLIGVAIALLVVVALVIAIVASGGDDGDGGDGGGGASVQGEQQPVVIDGTPLPELAAGDDAAIGMTPPTLQGASFDGSPLEIIPGGTDKMVVFLAHWCPHCNAEVPVLVEWQEKGRVPEGLDVIGVATASDESAPNYPPSKWLEGLGWPWPALADSSENEAAQAYGVNVFPFFVIVGEDGTVKGRFSGEMGLDDLDQAVRDALGTPA